MTDEEREQLGWRVDAAVRREFEQYAQSVFGETPGWRGRALEAAMQEFIGNDRIADVNERLDLIADSLGVEKKKGKGVVPLADGRYHVPEGKNPGDASKRQEAVIHAVLDLAEDDRLPQDDKGTFITQKLLKNRIEEVANVQSEKTIEKYCNKITTKGPFKRYPNRPGTWLVQP